MGKRTYSWQGIDQKGQPRSGLMQAENATQVREALRQQRIRTTRTRRHFNSPAWLNFKHAPQPQDVTRLTRQLATLLHAGIPLLQAFDALDRGEKTSPLKTIIRDVHTQLEQGQPLHLALNRHQTFSALYCNLVLVGEMAGALDLMLERIANHLEKSENLRASLRSALIYPCTVMVVAVVVLVLILVFVVPAFQSIFTSFGADLPWLTRVVVKLSTGLQHHGWTVLGLCSVLVWGGNRLLQQRLNWQHRLHTLLLLTPIAGPLARNACTARWSRTLATMFAAGIPLTEALDAVAGVTGNSCFESATRTIQRQLIQGQSLSNALMSAQDLFPSMLIQMCAIGEESGALDKMLEKTAVHYEQDVAHTVSRLTTLLEPLMMVVLGLLIGCLVLALYLPIFQMGQVV